MKSKAHKFVKGLALAAAYDMAQHERADALVTLAKLIDTKPIFVFSNETAELLCTSKAAIRSIETLVEFNLCHLPYPEMFVQFDTFSDKDCRQYAATWIVALNEKDGVFTAFDVAMKDEDAIYIADAASQIKVTTKGFDITTLSSPSSAQACALAVRLATLMQHISGLEREEVEPHHKLNKRRMARGEPLIRGYSYVHIGKVYGKDGTAHDRKGATGRTMPVHLRAGHVRQQAYGKGRELRKLIHIPPVVVNYHGDDAPQIEKRVVV